MATETANAAALRAFETYHGFLSGMTPDVELAAEIVEGQAPAIGANDGRNIVRWVKHDWDDAYDPAALAVTLMSYDTSSGRIVDADILINGETFPWSARPDAFNCSNAYDLQNVLTHEVGHLFGLAHDKSDTNATMYPSSAMCETKKRDLDDGDIAGLRYLYVDVAPPPTAQAAFGCSVAGGQNGFAPLLVMAALLGLRRARPLAAMALLLVCSRADATIMRHLSLDELSGSATIAARGTVRDQLVHWVDGRIVTDTSLDVEECLYGPCPAVATVRQLGGEIDGVGTTVEGTAGLSEGAEVVLVLRRRANGVFAPVGMAQGAFQVERDDQHRIRALVRDVRALRFAKTSGGSEEPGSLERLDLDELRRALARAEARHD